MNGALEFPSDVRVAVITGGASGIGKAVALAFHQRGVKVITIDRVEVETNWTHVVGDVSNSANLRDASRLVEREFGACNALVTAAGVAPRGTAGECTEDDWDDVFGINARGTWLTFQHFLPLLQHGSSVTTIASGAALRPLPSLAAYSASKAAIVALTRSIAIDYAASGIRANCICPGLIDTPLAHARTPDGDANTSSGLDAAGYLIPRLGSPEEVAAAVIFVSSGSAGYITGATLAVDGGRTLH
jgi:NAD(P)-dependent dehydrogenase (short-subunit alcohol dehydrogenase family)